jgi:hypothetical protein
LIRRQISPLVATALLGKLRSQMTAEQGSTVDALKKACPGYCGYEWTAKFKDSAEQGQTAG